MFIIDILTSPFSVLGIVIAGFYYYMTWTFDFWLKRGVPFRKPTILFGNFSDLLLFRKSQPDGIKDMYNWFRGSRYLGVFRVRSPILILRDPELVKHVCIKDFMCFTNRAIQVNTSEPLSRNLFNLEGKAWRDLRLKLTSAFSTSKMKRMFYLLNECKEELEKLIEANCREDKAIEVRDLTTKFTVDVIGSCAFGIHINALKDDETNAFRRMANELSKPSYKSTLWRMLRTSLPTLYRILGVRVIAPEVTDFFKDVVSQVIEQREREFGPKRHDLMDIMIQLKNVDRSDLENYDNQNDSNSEEARQGAKELELSNNDIAAQAFVFFLAGNETSSNTISFCLYELALNEAIQEKARREIRDEIEKRNGKLNYETVQDMKYLEMIIFETLRKYPSAPMLSRRCEYRYRIPGTEVELPAGIRVVIPIYGLHHDPEYYPEPDKFDPERFSDKNKNSRPAYTYLPFGDGPRNCIGMRFALLQVKMGIIAFLRDHRIEPCEKTVIPIKFSTRSLATSSEGGFWLKIKPIA